MLSLFLPRSASTHGRGDVLEQFWYTDVSHPVSAGVSVTENTALTYSAVWAATRLLCGTAGWLPLDLYRRLPKGGREVVWDDPRETLVHDQPNGEMGSMMFRCQAVMQQVNAGNCYAEIERTRAGDPLALWPIHHTRVRPVRDKETKALWYEVKSDDGSKDYFEPHDFLHVSSMMSDDGITGKGVIQHARETIGFGISAEKSGANQIARGMPRIVVQHPKKFNSESRNAFRKEWKEIYGGPGGDNVALLDDGAVAAPLNLSLKDAQYIESRQHNIEDMARWYGVPPHKLQHLIRATYDNVEQMGIEFVTDCLLPWLKLWEQELWRKLLTPAEQAEYFFEFNVTALLRGDAASRGEFYRLMNFIGALSPNEIRALENWNPYPGGDIYVMQQAMIPVDMLSEVTEAGIKQAEKPEPLPTNQKDTRADAVLLRAVTHQLHGVEQRLLAGTSSTVNTLRSELDARLKAIEQTTDNRTTVLVSAAKELLTGAISRMVHREATAARRAAGKPGEFLAWLDSFYADCSTYQEAVASPCAALMTLGYSVDAKQLATEQAAHSKSTLLDLSGGCTASDLASKVEVCVAGWESERAASVVEAVLTKGAE